MIGYTVRRVLLLAPLLWAVATITFLLMHAVPGGPYDTGDLRRRPEVQAAIEAKYGLDEPFAEQYVTFLGNLVRGDLGFSFARNRPVTDVMRDGLPTTVQLGLCAFTLALLVGIGLGVAAALNNGRWPDYVSVLLATAGAAVPGFVVAVGLVVVFALKLGWFDTIGWEFGNYRKMVLPVVALSLYPAAYIARVTRAAMLEVIHHDYVRTARAKGLRERSIVRGHVLRNAAIPILTVTGPIFASLLTGSFVIERSFQVPGVGTAFVDAVRSRDYGMVMGTTLLYAAAIGVANLLVDLGYTALDPRTTRQRA